MASSNPKPAKKDEDAEMEDSGEGSDDEPLGLLDRPVEIIETRRERKKVERLSLSNDAKSRKKEELDYSKGKGLKLGNIEIVRYEISRSLATELKPLHRLLYKQLGKPATIKKRIYEFCGFPFEKDSKEYADVDWQMEKFAKMGLLRLCEIFGLSLKGNRDELKARVIDFLMEPHKTDKKVPGTVTSSKKKGKKRKAESSNETPQKKKKSAESEDENDDNEEKTEDVDEEEDRDDKEKKKKKEEKPKKKESKSKPKKATVIKLPTPSKKKKVKAKEEKPKKKKPSAKTKKTGSDSEENEPLSKIPKGPSDEEIEKVVQELLDGADLETVTMKMICKQVFDKFPNHDLTERKSFIKETVKQIIS